MLLNSTGIQDYLGISRSTLYRLLKNTDFPKVKVGSQWRFDLEEVDRWVKEH